MSGIKHLPGLNGMRAAGVLMIMVFHFSQHMSAFGFALREVFPYAHQMVVMFFVLSGFLITNLLLREQDTNGEINIRHFYMRRLLRVWPAYFIAIMLLVTVYYFLGQPLDTGTLLLYTFFLGNIPIVLGTGIGPVSQLWSLGVEEQFYLVWPWLFRSRKWVLPGILASILVYYIFRGYFAWSGHNRAYSLLLLSSYQCMAWGGLLAWGWHHGQRWISWMYHPALQVLAWGWCLFNTCWVVKLPGGVMAEWNAVMFGIIMLNVATNSSTLLTLESRWLNWIGKISYGIYLYHMFAFSVVLKLLQHRLPANWLGYAVVIAAAGLVAILGAWLSYILVEKYFLRLKGRFARSEAPIGEAVAG